MNEIEKMYENAEVEKQYYYFDSADGNTYTWELNENGNDKYNMCFIGKPKIKDREFTAEKQIAILIFILNKFGDIGFQKMYSIIGNDESTRKDFIKCLCDCEHETWDSHPVDFYYQKGASGDNFEESLAGLINNLWQDLTESEQEQIRSILNG